LLHNGVERVKITDFGLARALDDASLTQSGCVAGTPQYMAPEQARGEAVDHRADLFSLGSVLYAMCTGRPPFRASTTLAVLKRVSEEKPRALAEVNPEIPRWLIEVIEKLHAQVPTDRFQSAAEVAELLNQYLAPLQYVPPLPQIVALDKPPKALTLQPSRSARYRRWAVAAALLLLSGGGLALTDAAGVTHLAEFLGTVLRIRTPEGTLVVEVDDPQVQVTIEGEGEELAIHGAGPQVIHLKPGQHRIRATKDGRPVPVDKELVTITRGGKQIVKISQEAGRLQAGKDLGHKSQESARPSGDPDSPTPAHLQTVKNLREIGRAIERWHEANHHYPPPFVYGENRKPLWSWRVLILPFLGEEKLYKEFKLHQPWDSPHNSRLLAKRPKVFAPPTGPFQKGDRTFYRALAGMVVEGGEPVPWTEPEELVYKPGKPLPRLGGLFPDRFYVLMRDSSVHAIKKDGFDEENMFTLLLRNQGQIVDLDALKP
jgi:hypothetical protein